MHHCSNFHVCEDGVTSFEDCSFSGEDDAWGWGLAAARGVLALRLQMPFLDNGVAAIQMVNLKWWVSSFVAVGAAGNELEPILRTWASPKYQHVVVAGPSWLRSLILRVAPLGYYCCCTGADWSAGAS
ncbi:hypothetical protein ABL78_8259 [Leptomonas seymouri]|uniref:Uncharacterized protein n=1 Tax=Leptomonas seymouri TaxID=5684 RepID=A0A0N1I0U7_LEPSE|nr:hypothetical protein ABL78_8259 [Leptomonas seymouri]|eukprot:KPI82730.1 hypothetical protein ABL78_8259 [Leptomonas seymouri]